LIFLFLVSCGASTLSDLRLEAEGEVKKLAAELREIEEKEELQKAVPRLKKRFLRIGELLVAAREFPKEEGLPTYGSEELFLELARLYEMPGARELIEFSQMEAVEMLRR
jgi:hypothetical protein